MSIDKEKYHSDNTHMEFLNKNILKVFDRHQNIEIALDKDELNWIYQKLKIVKENLQVDCIPRNCGGCLHNIHDFIILTNSPCRDCCRSKAYQDLYIKKEVDEK